MASAVDDVHHRNRQTISGTPPKKRYSGISSAFAAALGIKAYLEQNDVSGTVILYGCPGEEGGAAKAFMARDGLWKKLDAALTWHPEDVNEVATGSSNSCIQNTV